MGQKMEKNKSVNWMKLFYWAVKSPFPSILQACIGDFIVLMSLRKAYLFSSSFYLFSYFPNVSVGGEPALSWVQLYHCLPTQIVSEFFLKLLWVSLSQPFLCLQDLS